MEPIMPPPIPPRPPEHPTVSPSTMLLILGSSLIVIAIVVLIAFSWNSFLPVERVLVSLLPLVVLYGLAYRSGSVRSQPKLSFYTALAGSVLFPLVLGIILYQTGLFGSANGPVDSLLVLCVSLISLIWYALLEFGYRQSSHGPLTVAAAVLAIISFANVVQAPDYVYSLLFALLAYFLISTATFFRGESQEMEERVYKYSGIIAALYGLLTFPIAFTSLDFDFNTVLLYLPVAALFFLLAVLFSQRWQAERRPDDLQARQIFEQCFALTLVLPAVFASFSDNSAETIVLLIILSALSLAFSTVIRVGTLLWLGLMGLVLGVLEILVFFADQSIPGFWTILLLILGFILIGIAYGMHYLPEQKLIRKLWNQQSPSWFRLGEAPAAPATPDSVSTTGSSRSADHGSRVIWFVILALLLIIFFFNSLIP
ncbi:DUF2157 domain-containing protein [Patescibacteria group bacterium]|nr:DUF2157 domain-containing protein [Patescibacteria group bacterium]